MIIYAVNIHSGGGKVLLLEVIREAEKVTHLFVDQRCPIPENFPKGKLTRVRPNIASRLLAEFKLKKFSIKHPTTSILMFGNLPPILKQTNKVILFLQNVFLSPEVKLTDMKLKTKIRIFIERTWLYLFKRNINEVWVQGEHVKQLFLSYFSNETIKVNPIVPIELLGPPINRNISDLIYDFIYVASPDKHKNIHRIIDAWEKMSLEKKTPSLILILTTEDKELKNRIMKLNSNCDIVVKSSLTRNEVIDYYLKSKALIYPSLFESFGLPLFEAHKLGLKIIASNRPFVTELNIADKLFDPLSIESIISAIQS